MPAFAPRSEPVKKSEELALRKHFLENSILNNVGLEQITKHAEKYRDTSLLYNKSLLHVIIEKELQGKKHSYKKEKALSEIEIWARISVDEIIDKVNRELKNRSIPKVLAKLNL